MPGLEKFNAKLRERGAELIGVNVQAGESQKTLDEAKDILSKQGATYRNIVIDDDSNDARAYISKIFSFPTTIIVDKNGNIIGKPILGNIDDEAKMEEILKVIDDLKSGKDTSSSITSEENPEMDKVAALFAKENEVFAKHQNLWDKVFAKIQKDKIPSEEQTSYPEFLKSQVEKTKEEFTEEELQILNDDIKEIEKIETENGVKKLRLQRIHIEEDTGKSIHNENGHTLKAIPNLTIYGESSLENTKKKRPDLYEKYILKKK